jgi:MoxR-like ATPase
LFFPFPLRLWFNPLWFDRDLGDDRHDMTPQDLREYLDRLVAGRLHISTMIWGPPGIGKSSIVAQVAAAHKLDFIDVRLSQLAPTDLRGLPVPENGRSRWFPPEFLPDSGKGILFLDELNMAPPAMQGIAQQLILDRKVGSYCYDDQTRVMTRDGLKFFRDLSDTDELMTLNPHTKQIEYHRPLRRIELPFRGDMLHFSGKGISLCVSPDHRMYVRATHRTEFEFITAADLAEKNWHRYRVKKNGDWSGEEVAQVVIPPSQRAQERIGIYDKVMDLRATGMGNKRISDATGLHIRRVEAYLYYGKDPRRSYHLDNAFDPKDWAEFIGWYVTEGSVFKAHNHRILISQDREKNPEKYARIVALLDRMGLHARQEKTGLMILSAALYDALAPLGKSKEKHLPAEVKNLPKDCLAVLLEAMLLGDGDGERKFFTASERLRDDFCEVAIKLGYGVSFSRRAGSGYAKPENSTWLVHLSDTNVEHHISRLDRVPYEGTIYCVTVPNHIVMVERDGRMAWCGNCVPEGWFIWAAGNRKEDKASVFEMPAPLANRFLHLSVAPDFDSFKAYALAADVSEQVIAFLSFRPSLLHKPDAQSPAWPSPRSWEMASRLHNAGLDIAPVVGEGAAAEFEAYRKVYNALPDLAAIVDGRGDRIAFPGEPSVRYATTIGLTVRADNADKAFSGFTWIAKKAPAEWTQLFIADLIPLMRNRGLENSKFLERVNKDAFLMKFVMDTVNLQGGR